MRGIAAGMGLPLPGAWRALSGAAGVGVGLVDVLFRDQRDMKAMPMLALAQVVSQT